MSSDEAKSTSRRDNFRETIDSDDSALDIHRDERWDDWRVGAILADLQEAVCIVSMG